MRYFIELSYFGKAYHGWQNQPNAISVQQMIEESLSKVLRNKIEITGAGRTDAGVHAKQMFAHFDFTEKLDEEILVYKLNSMLPKDIAIANIFEVTEDAHARFDAVSRSYAYQIIQKKSAFEFGNSWFVNQELDIEKMNEASDVLLNYKDFKSFSKTRTDVKTFDCDITEAKWISEEDHLIFTISADRFLRNMVRAIVGTLVEIGQNKYPVAHMKEVIESKDRSIAGASVPAHGLYLTGITYPDSIFKMNGE
ncbi:tRNA pseudouridine(38-40) synthase TruA [Gramella sp. AN32]|uniref:tRNA pseudouridine synthase A n=1 Tax=Christiangramia antarctica TaxID=2058158 RepID=A0ABW5X657_9FLAO|nr:tRNA pseudouridine(38-40) synthase TruA [Gramella sp. AN32]MCM4154779.1 tRNA pseudouridine(38-40) synthase TruA [Gramella sp. AN32]